MSNLGEGIEERAIEKVILKMYKEGCDLKYTPQNGHDKKKGSLKMDTRRRDKILVSGQ